jgi:hypothetical protein
MTTKKYPEPQAFEKTPRPSIHLKPVKSSQIHSIGYDPDTKTLAVSFTRGSGAIYHYPDVDAELAESFRKAESIGNFFGQHIKSRQFKKYAAS